MIGDKTALAPVRAVFYSCSTCLLVSCCPATGMVQCCGGSIRVLGTIWFLGSGFVV